MKNNKKKELSYNPTFAGIISAVASGIISLIVGVLAGKYTTEVKYHDAVTYNNISSYIDSMIVKPGLIDKNILSLDNPFEQINMLAETIMDQQKINTEMINNQQTNYNDILASMREYLIDFGKDESLINEYTQDELLDELDKVIMSAKTMGKKMKNWRQN